MNAVFETLSPAAGEVAVDLTAGMGGHASSLASKIGSAGSLCLCDLDPTNLARACEAVRESGFAGNIVESPGSYARAPQRLLESGLKADCALADLGFSSTQVDDASRGFSFKRDGPLDMRYAPDSGPSAADLIATRAEEELADLIWTYGEERRSRGIARKLVAVREQQPITTTGQLAEIVRSVVPRTPGSRIDPATRTFQALRIAVNDELGHLRLLLESISRAAGAPQGRGSWLAPGARIAIISFHSLEDRLVKQCFAELGKRGIAKVLTRSPMTADEDEAEGNPRARSAKLRAVRIHGISQDPPT
jgi:16S rRNA (cytosine1402-N4)-methyltransferase